MRGGSGRIGNRSSLVHQLRGPHRQCPADEALPCRGQTLDLSDTRQLRHIDRAAPRLALGAVGDDNGSNGH